MNTSLAYQEDDRYEIIDGEVIMMSPRPSLRHNFVSINIYNIFNSYLKGKSCKAIPDGTDLYLNDENHYIPDVMVVCEKEKLKSNAVYGAPAVVVEVLSFSTRMNDRKNKLKVYEKAGVKEYWIVDPNMLSIEQYVLVGEHFELDNVWGIYSEVDAMKMTEEEKASVPGGFYSKVFPELYFDLKDIFDEWALSV